MGTGPASAKKQFVQHFSFLSAISAGELGPQRIVQKTAKGLQISHIYK